MSFRGVCGSVHVRMSRWKGISSIFRRLPVLLTFPPSHVGSPYIVCYTSQSWLFISLLLILPRPVGILECLQFTSCSIFTTCLLGNVCPFKIQIERFLFQAVGGLESVEKQAWIPPCLFQNLELHFSFIHLGALPHISIFYESYDFIIRGAAGGVHQCNWLTRRRKVS